MTSLLRSSSRHALLGGAALAVTTLTAASALADPPPAAPTPPAAPAPFASAPPPFAPAARPPYYDPSRPLYPAYFYLPQDLSPPQAHGVPGAPSPRVWYGWQTLFVHAATTTVGLSGIFIGAISSSDALVLSGSVIGSAGFLLGGPMIHWARGNTSRGFEALGLNFGAPVVGAGIGVGIGCAAGGCSNHDGGVGIILGMFFGGIAGLVTAIVVDVSVLSYETKTPLQATASRRSPGWTILPDLKLSREKTTFGFAGVF